MNSRAEIWNILHDGEISAIDGTVPGNIDLRIVIPYLRQMFSGDGEYIVLRLVGCTKFSMKIWEPATVTDDFKRIEEISTTILNTESEDVPVRIISTFGELEVDFQDFSLALDDSRGITFDEICIACEKYWNRWEKEAAVSNPTPSHSPASC